MAPDEAVAPTNATSAQSTSPDATPADVSPADVTPADVAPADVTPADVAPAKATGRKAASRKAGMAARTEITPAKAFPQDAARGDASPRADGPSAAGRPPRKAAKKANRPANRATAAGAGESVPPAQTLPFAEPAAPDLTSAPAPTGAGHLPAPIEVAHHQAIEAAAVPAIGVAPADETVAPTVQAADTAADTTPAETAPAETRLTDTPSGDTPSGHALPGDIEATRDVDEDATDGSAGVSAGTPLEGTAERADTVATAGQAAGQLRQTAVDAWARVSADPRHTAELLALTAVQTMGPRAADWAREVRESYPTATAEGIARLAIRQFTRRGGVSSALAAVAGAYAPVALLGTAAYHHAQLVLHVAAAYGQDPSDPARAADLLVLTRVHPSREDAEAALAAAQAPAGADPNAGDRARRLGRTLAVQAGGWATLRLLGRFFPGTGMVVAAVTSRAATETLGVRATTYYRSLAD